MAKGKRQERVIHQNIPRAGFGERLRKIHRDLKTPKVRDDGVQPKLMTAYAPIMKQWLQAPVMRTGYMTIGIVAAGLFVYNGVKEERVGEYAGIATSGVVGGAIDVGQDAWSIPKGVYGAFREECDESEGEFCGEAGSRIGDAIGALAGNADAAGTTTTAPSPDAAPNTTTESDPSRVLRDGAIDLGAIICLKSLDMQLGEFPSASELFISESTELADAPWPVIDIINKAVEERNPGLDIDVVGPNTIFLDVPIGCDYK